MTILYTDDLFLHHDTGAHPENANRLRAITAQLQQAGLLERCQRGTIAALDPERTTLVHDPIIGELARIVCHRGGGRLDVDTPVCPESYQVALAAAGTCSAAVDAILDGQDTTALCLVRPPGHHATPRRSMGFCIFNNVALAACRARERGLDRILIIDWDVHHGNGTQDIFYADPDVTFFSIHRYGHGFYPGTGAEDETGTGAGLGTTHNAALPFGISRRDYLACFRSILESAADRCKPQLVLLSAGFDAHALDPIGSLGLEVEDFVTMTDLVLDVARTHAGGKLVSCLEGGYNVRMLAESVQGHLERLMGTQGVTREF